MDAVDRYVFVSFSFLMKEYKEVPADILESSIFFFGSKRFWLFPSTDEEIEESRNQPTPYLSPSLQNLRDLVLRKEKRGEIFFLKPDNLGEPDKEVFCDFLKGSKFLEGLGYNALKSQGENMRI